jgi:acyl carrier protein
MSQSMTTNRTALSAQLTLDQALAWIAEMFEEPRANVTPSTLRSELPTWDSLGQLVLMSGLDQRFGIKLTPEELGSLSSVQGILDILSTRGCLAER